MPLPEAGLKRCRPDRTGGYLSSLHSASLSLITQSISFITQSNPGSEEDAGAMTTAPKGDRGMGVITSRTVDSPVIGTGSNARGFNIMSWLKKNKTKPKGT
ncbi:hypothetical protein TSAR_003273 [Trichomalopsis sarcophagae]|uniref:Uncharacterized protein n=1 Tax=Trichomalopsis sarcophagae TaxID=543379 RepID=A0A232EHM6_9HYME|nr:hypothetical protein TSAR_003273 [Trichomalopsis sarcophagae]